MSKEKIKAGILGCTGAVGQKLIAILDKHPLFEVTEIAASERSAGNVYEETVNWLEPNDIPENIAKMKIKNCIPELDCKILFSGLDSKVAGDIESTMAKSGYVVVSNSRNHRMFENVPLIIPEINAEHYKLIESQRQNDKEGFIVTNPNCSTIVLCLSLYPIYKSFGLKKVMVTTMQAISGAGYPGVPSLDILGNVVPHIPDEEIKMETETLKIFGKYENGKINFSDFKVSAMCNRVPVRDGHTISVSFETEKKASRMEILNSLDEYNTEFLKDAGIDVIRYFENPFRPQPILDAGKGNGMTVSVGNLRECNVLDWKYTALGHNTIRGAAGAAIVNAEYLVKEGLL